MMKRDTVNTCVLTVAASLLLFVYAPLFADTADDGFFKQEEKMTVFAASGDMHKYYSELGNAIIQHYSSPRLWVYLQQLHELGGMAGQERLLNILQKARKIIYDDPSVQHKNLLLLQLDLEIEKTVNRLRNVTLQHSSLINPVNRWVMAGPYRRYGAGDLWYSFIQGIHAGSDGLLEDGKRVNAGKTRGIVRLDEVTANSNGIMYAVSSFAASGQVKLRVYSNGEYILKVNGKAVLENSQETVKRNTRIVLVDVDEGVTCMLKLRTAPGVWFRVLVTDGSDALVPVQFTEKKYTGLREYMESLDYPFPLLAGDIQDGKRYAFARMGLYFQNLGSRESIKYYRSGWEKSGSDGYLAWLYLDALMSARVSRPCDAELKIAGNVLDELGGRNNIPTRYQYARYLASTGRIEDAIQEGMEILSKAKGYLPAYEPVFRWSNEKSRDDLVVQLLDNMEIKFPHCTEGRLLKAEYLEKSDPSASEKICRDILKKEYSDRARKILVSILSSQQRYDDLISYSEIPGERWNYMEALFEAYMALEKFDECRSFLMKEMVKRDNIRGLYFLGKMEMLQGEDPDLYWEKLLRDKPEWYWFRDMYSVYTGTHAGNHDNGTWRYDCPGAPVIDKNGETVKHSRRIEFKLPAPGYCEISWSEIIVSGRETAPDNTITVPFTGNIRIRESYACKNGKTYPVKAVVEEKKENTVVFLKGIKSSSVVKFSMDIRDALSDGLGDSFVTMQGLFQGNGNTTQNTEVQITCPVDMHLRVVSSGASKKGESVKNEKREYTATFNAPGSGISFTTCESWQDFALVYNALLRKSTAGFDLAEYSIQKNPGTLETVHSIFRKVQQGITLRGGSIFEVGRSVDVLYSKEGSAAAKTVLAKNMLAGQGMASYLAFPMKKKCEGLYGDSPNYGRIMKPLLYVPVNDDKIVWLDFSGIDKDISSIPGDLAGVTALVLVGDTVEWVKIEKN